MEIRHLPRTVLAMTRRRAGIYIRQSADFRLGTVDEGAAVDRNLKLCRAYAATIDAEVIDEYVDNDKSATKENVIRDEYKRLIADLVSGRIDMVITNDQDRLLRDGEDSERFLKLAKRKRFLFASPSGGILDLATDGARLQFRVKTAFSVAEMERKSERHLVENAQRAAAGRRHGGPKQFGFNVPPSVRLPKGVSAEQLPEDDPRRIMALAKVTISEPQAAVIRDVARRLLVGESLNSIVNDLNALGITTVNGRKWSPHSLRYTMLRASISGRRQYIPMSSWEMREDGTMRRPPIGEITSETSDYPPIISPAEHDKIRALLTDPSRVTTRATPRRLLSGIGRCFCGSPLYGRPKRRRNDTEAVPYYVCAVIPGRSGCNGVAIHAGHLDDHVQKIVVGALQDPEFRERLHVADDTTDVAARLKDAEDELAELAALKNATPSMSLKEYTILRNPLAKTVDECRAQLNQTDRGRALALVAGPLAEVPAVWQRLTIPQRRLVIEAIVDHVAVKRRTTGPGVRLDRFDPSRFRVKFRDEG